MFCLFPQTLWNLISGSEKTDLYKVSDEIKYQLGGASWYHHLSSEIGKLLLIFYSPARFRARESCNIAAKKINEIPKVFQPIEFVGLSFHFCWICWISLIVWDFQNLSSPFLLDLFSLVNIPSPMPFFWEAVDSTKITPENHGESNHGPEKNRINEK